MQLQFIVALLVVLALCEGCAGMNPERLNIGGNDKRNSSNFTNSPNQPETQGKGKGKAKMYSSGSDDGRQSMHQNSFNFGGLNASTNSGTRGGSQTAYTNVSNYFSFNPSTNSGTPGGSQTAYTNVSNYFGFIPSTNPANVSNFGGFNPSTNSGTRGGSQTGHTNVSNFGGFIPSTNSGTRGGSQTAHTNVSNYVGLNASTNSGKRKKGGRSRQNFKDSAALQNAGGNTSKRAEPEINYFKAKSTTKDGASNSRDYFNVGVAMLGTDTSAPGIITGYSQDELEDVVTVLTSGISEERRIATERMLERKRNSSSWFSLGPSKE